MNEQQSMVLKKLRNKLGITQHELSERAKISRPMYSCYETGIRELDKKNGEKLYRFFVEHVNNDELVLVLEELLKERNIL